MSSIGTVTSPSRSYGDFTSEGLKRWIIGSRQAGISPASINTRITGINAFLKWSEAGHKLDFLKEEERALPTYPVEHLKWLVDFKPKGLYEKRLHVLFLTIVDTGLRIEETLTLTTDCIDFHNMLIRVKGKGRKERLIPLAFHVDQTNTDGSFHLTPVSAGDYFLIALSGGGGVAHPNAEVAAIFAKATISTHVETNNVLNMRLNLVETAALHLVPRQN